LCTPLIIITGLVFSIRTGLTRHGTRARPAHWHASSSTPSEPKVKALYLGGPSSGLLATVTGRGTGTSESAPLARDAQILHQHAVTHGTGPATWQNARRAARFEPGRRQQQAGCYPGRVR
jgi:hypothetical protein